MVVDINTKQEKMRETRFIGAILLIFAAVLALPTVGSARVIASETYHPTPYLTEEISSMYYPNGSLVDEYGEGSAKAFSEDVLQEVSFKLDSIEGTNLISTEAYRPSIASPDGRPSKLYVNTTDSESDLNYEIDLDHLEEEFGKVPRIKIEVDHRNIDGGRDLHSSKNTFEFNLSLSANQDMEGVNFNFTVPDNTGPNGESAFDFKDPKCSEGDLCVKEDRTRDGNHETIRWRGDLDEETVEIEFLGETVPGENFIEDSAEDIPPINMSQGDYVALHENDGTHTEIELEHMGGKGDVRTGMHMSEAPGGSWIVQGFIENRASHLTYFIDSWGIYRKEDESPVKEAEEGGTIEPGEIFYTERYESGDYDDKYYYTLFDWEVIWADSVYRKSTRSGVLMPPLYQIRSRLTEPKITLLENTLDSRTVRVRNDVTNLGDEKVNVSKLKLFSKIPGASYNETPSGWEVDRNNVKVEYNDGELDITGDSDIEIVEPVGTEDGHVLAELNIDESEIDSFDQNDEIALEYVAEGDSVESDETYGFYWNSTIESVSGTPDTQEAYGNIIIQGIEEPDPEDPDPTPRPEPERLEIDPITSSVSTITGNLVKVERSDLIIDTGNRGLRNTNFELILPEGTDMEEPTLNIWYGEDGETELGAGDYRLEDMGEVRIGDKMRRVYEVNILEDEERGLVLEDGEIINLTYNARLNFGTNEITTRLSGYDYYEDRFIHDDAVKVIRVGWELEDLKVDRGQWEQSEAVIGEPVRWEREVAIENPNDDSITRTLEINLPREAFTCSIDGEELEILEGGARKSVKPSVSLSPLEKKVLTLKTYTPPVFLEEEEIEILESNETQVKFLLENRFLNPSPHRYRDVYRLLDLHEDQIKWATIEGESADYFETDEGTKIGPMEFRTKEEKSMEMVYRELPPVLVVKTDTQNYTDPEMANISVLAVTDKGHVGSNIELTILGPEGSTVYSEVLGMHEETFETTKQFNLKGLPPGNYTIEADLRRGFEVLKSDTTNFWVVGEEAILVLKPWYLLGVLAIVVALLAVRVHRKKDLYKRRVEEVRKKLKKKF